MKIKLWSDLHLEFRENKFDHLWSDKSSDELDTTLLLAGDIGVGMGGTEFVTEMCKHFKHVLRICGNHEFYDHDHDSIIAGWTEFEETGPDNFHFLNNDWRELDGVRFLGGTMWTGMNNGDYRAISDAERGMNDYACIKHKGMSINPRFTIMQHNKFMDALNEKLAEPFDGPTVVMSHHSPGNFLKRKQRQPYGVDHAYFADLEELIGNHTEIKLWVHGHTHENWDYMINETRVVCNPYGYHGYATNKGFDRDIILEV